ncbi:ATP-dependent DNA helicase PIF1-like protein [Tanacetum coccineum]
MELGAASISKKITADLKGKAIGDPNNVATTKTRRTTIGVELFQHFFLKPRGKTSKNRRKPAALASPGVEVSYHSLGAPSYQCPNCNAAMWYEERNNKANKDKNPTFSLCYQQGKVLLSRFKDTHEPLNRLLDYNQPATSTFRDLIRVYNGMFCFTSFGAKIDHSINKGRGLYTLSLLPIEGTQPRYAQLWFFDTHNEIRNQLGAFMDTDSEEGVNGTIVGSLIRMLDANSAIAKAFRMAKDWCHPDTTANVELRLLSERTRSKQYNSPNVAEVAALITNDFGDGEPTRDIVVCKKDSPPKRITELHLSYMALQYPLLFPYGEDSYHEKISYHTNKGKRKTTRDYVTMKEYYAYVIQYRKDQWTTLHRGSRLFQQYLVDAFTAIEEQRLSWTRNNQDTLRVNLYHNVVDAITKGDINAAGLGKRIVLPISFTGGPRCKATTDIDDIISAELPSPTTDPAGYKAVSDYMLHGPCGKDNKAAACNVEGKCSKHFPKPFYAETVIDQDGYPIYRRRDDKVCVKKEPCEAVWRIFSFDIHHSYPSVMKLNFHMPNQQPVTLHDTECLPALLQKEGLLFKYPELQLTTEQIQNYCLIEIQDLLNTNGRTLIEFCDMPQPNPTLLTSVDNRLIREARAFDINKSRIPHQLYPQLNLEQRLIYEEVVDSVHNKKGQFHFVYGPRGIASLLLPGGMTAHSRQILLVVPKGKRANIVQACINRSELWKHYKVLAIGDGKVPARVKDGEDEPTWIEIQETFLIPSSESPIQQIVKETYPNFIQRQKDDAYLRERVILTHRNADADVINAYMFDNHNTQDHLIIYTVKMALCLEKTAIPGKAMIRNDNQQKPGTVT